MAERPGTERPCARCKMNLIFLEGKSGPERPMPAQKVRAVYVRDGDRVRKVTVTRLEREDGTVMENAGGLELVVNHYETCPHASAFSRRGQRRAGAN